MPNVTVYQLPTVVQLIQNVAVSVGTVINRTDFNLHKGVTNEIEFLIKTIDRKPVNLDGKSFMIYIVEQATDQLVIQADLLNVIPERGHARLSLSDADVSGLNPGYYRFVVTEVRIDSQIAVYTDQNHSLRGFLEVFQGPLPATPPVYTIPGNEFSPEQWGNPMQTYNVSEALPGAAQRGNRSGTHTLAVYSQNFSGELTIQASLSDVSPTQSEDWFDVLTQHIAEEDTVTGIPFVGNYQWVRAFYKPDNLSTGSVTKAVLKN